MAATAIAQPPPTPERWVSNKSHGQDNHWPRDVRAQRDHFPKLQLAMPWPADAKMLFRPENKKKKVLADLFQVTSPDDPVLENGSKLCKGRVVLYLIVGKPEKTWNEPIPALWLPFPVTGSPPAPQTIAGTMSTAPIALIGLNVPCFVRTICVVSFKVQWW